MQIPKTGKLIKLITANINNYITEKIAYAGINYGQFEYFLYISTHEGTNQNELAKYKKVGKASVTKAIKILEKKDLIKRIIDEDDKRNFKLYVTDKGKKYREEFKSYRDEITNKVFDGFSDEEKGALNSMLERMYQNTLELFD